MPPAFDSLPDTLQHVRTRPLFVMRLDVRKLQIVGATPGAFAASASCRAARSRASAFPARCWRAAPTGRTCAATRATTLDVRLVLKTHDEAMIGMTYRGLRLGPPDVMARLEQGETVDPASYYFRTTAFFETAAPSYAWLNTILAIGIGHRFADGPAYSLFEVL